MSHEKLIAVALTKLLPSFCLFCGRSGLHLGWGNLKEEAVSLWTKEHKVSPFSPEQLKKYMIWFLLLLKYNCNNLKNVYSGP